MAMKVKIKFSRESLFYKNNIKGQVWERITEIHFNYDGRKRIAFESDIDGTGASFDVSDIEEFEAKE